MTFEQQVRQAPNPLEALLVLARALDALQAKPTLDSWAGWAPGTEQAPPPTAPAQPSLTSADLPDDVVIAWMQKNYKGAAGLDADSTEGQMAIAQVREDLLLAPNVQVVEDLFRQTTEGIVESDIDWSPLTEKHRAARYQFAKDVLQLDVALGPHPEQGDWAADYASGGPMYLYIPNRDLVKQYPENVRSQMVEDVRITTHARQPDLIADKLTHEFGGDLLQKPMSTDLERRAAPLPVGLR